MRGQSLHRKHPGRCTNGNRDLRRPSRRSCHSPGRELRLRRKSDRRRAANDREAGRRIADYGYRLADHHSRGPKHRRGRAGPGRHPLAACRRGPPPKGDRCSASREVTLIGRSVARPRRRLPGRPLVGDFIRRAARPRGTFHSLKHNCRLVRQRFSIHRAGRSEDRRRHHIGRGRRQSFAPTVFRRTADRHTSGIGFGG